MKVISSDHKANGSCHKLNLYDTLNINVEHAKLLREVKEHCTIHYTRFNWVLIITFDSTPELRTDVYSEAC